MRFKNRYGINVAADLYVPNNARGRLPALVVSDPFGAVKEQSSELYANEFARRGYVALAFDPSFTGESGGTVRNVASPDIFTEDYSAAVDFLGLQKIVDRERIGAQAVCGLSGMALTAAAADSRIKAVATASMYDMSRSMSRGHQDYHTREQRQKVVDYLSRQRWIDAENGTFARGSHEVPFDENGNVAPSNLILPKSLPADADPITKIFFDYYRTERLSPALGHLHQRVDRDHADVVLRLPECQVRTPSQPRKSSASEVRKWRGRRRPRSAPRSRRFPMARRP